MPIEPDITHSLPEEYIEKLREETEIIVGLYNELNDLPTETFESRFSDTLDDVHTYSDAHSDAELLFFVLGVNIADEETLEEGELIGDAETKFVFELGDDEFIDSYHYMADTVADSDYFLLVTLQPGDCPPGSGQPASEVTIETYHDIVAALLYQRIDLFQNDVEAYQQRILTPIVAALEDHPDTELPE